LAFMCDHANGQKKLTKHTKERVNRKTSRNQI